MSDLNGIMVRNAFEALKDADAAAVILFLDAVGEWDVWKRLPYKKRLILATQDESHERSLEPLRGELMAVVKLPEVKLTRLSQIKLSTVMCITEGVIKPGDKVVCLSGVRATGILDTLIIIDLSRESELITTSGLSRDLLKKVAPEVLETVLNIALELSTEGREGKPVGATFVVGDHEKVMKLSRPLIMNPFKGYPEESRNILDRAVHETIKEFALLDGAFLIREDGVVMSAGVHLDAALEDDGHLHGLGCRHMAAAGITDVTDAAAITISGSTGIVRIFKNGRVLMEIEKPPAGAQEIKK